MAKKNRARKRGEAMVGSGERLNIARAMIGQRSAKRPNNKGERVLNWEPRCLLCKRADQSLPSSGGKSSRLHLANHRTITSHRT